MASKTNQLSACESLLCNCTKSESLKAEEVISFEKLPMYEESIASKLSKLPKIKAQPGFDQRMAAAFAMELEKEILLRNQSWLKKHPKITLPDIITDLKNNLL